jgi:hypothetical protein
MRTQTYNPAYAGPGNCIACHSGDFRAGEHPYTATPQANYKVGIGGQMNGQLANCSGACHTYTTGPVTSSTPKSKTRNGPQHRVNGNGW